MNLILNITNQDAYRSEVCGHMISWEGGSHCAAFPSVYVQCSWFEMKDTPQNTHFLPPSMRQIQSLRLWVKVIASEEGWP